MQVVIYVPYTCIPYLEIYRDCEQAYLLGQTSSGIYSLKPDDNGPAFEAYCDMTTDQGGWTVIQRRNSGSVNFFLNWINYVRGFGDLNGEFWLGLRNIQRLAGSSSQLRVDLGDWTSSASYAKYNDFSIGSAASKYSLSVSGYNGTAGDSLTYHNGAKFTTQDQDNDGHATEICAVVYKGAWWYQACHFSNLNGAYLGTGANNGVTATYADGIIWHAWRGYNYSLKFSEMKVRRN